MPGSTRLRRHLFAIALGDRDPPIHLRGLGGMIILRPVLFSMTNDQIAAWNAELRSKSPLEITRWAIAQAQGRAIVSTNFRPYEAAILHLCTQVEADSPVLWVDHGY